MNTIKLYLAESGRIADLKKDFPLYQGQFQDKLLNIFVPTSILAPNFVTQNAEGQVISDYVASTGVKIGMTYTARDGTIKVSKNYYMRYLKTLTYQGVEYALYERKLPKEFTLYAGQGENAPVLIVNVVNIQQDTEDGIPKILSIVTTQTCYLDVMPSTNLDRDETIEPSELDNLNAQISEINEILPLKQDKTDYALATTEKTVVGAINENKGRIEVNIGNIETNTEDIADLRNEIDTLRETVATQEEYIGQLSGSALPSEGELTSYVESVAERQPQNADVVIFVLEQGTQTRTYKYTYYAGGWKGYQITSLPQSSNSVFGTLKGTYGNGNNNEVLIDISGGEIRNIYVKDNNGVYRNLKEYLGTTTTNIGDIVAGRQSVGVALKSVADEVGNDIIATYLTKNLGATKQFVRDYAMPREFSSVFFIASDGYQTTVPTTPESGIQFTTTTNDIGSFQIFQLTKQNNASFELTISNGYQNNIFISANRDCEVAFRLKTEYKKVGEDWANLVTELTNNYVLASGDIQKISFSSPFTALGDNVITLGETAQIRQTLEVITNESAETTFDLYSNEIYPSIFTLTSQAFTSQDAELIAGKVVLIGLDGIIEGGNAIFTVVNPNDFIEFRTNQRKFLCSMSLPVVGEVADTTPVKIVFGDTLYNLYSFMEGGATPLTIGDLASVKQYNSAIGYSFYPELIFIETSDIVGFVISPATFTGSQLLNILSDNGSVISMQDGNKVSLSLKADLTNKIMRALVTPVSAPPETEIVAIDDNGSQTMLELGNSLQVVNGVLDVNAQQSGTVVTVGGVAQTTFNADTKVDTSTYNTKVGEIDNSISTLTQDLNTAEQDIADNMVAIEGKIAKVSNATQNNIAVFDNNGGVKDSGVDTGAFANKVANATNNHFASLDANGNLKDSGIASENVVTTNTTQTITGSKYLNKIYFEDQEENYSPTYKGCMYQFDDCIDFIRVSATGDSSAFSGIVRIDLAKKALLVNGQDINTLSMRPSDTYSQTSIGGITTDNTLVFTAPANGFATIRGEFGATTSYYLKSTNGTNTFYQRASSTSSPFFAMKKGDQIYLATATTIRWADLYFVSATTI